ncbi:MAG: FAD-dependent oxidoreductase, partial [Actinomycetota bacterium]
MVVGAGAWGLSAAWMLAEDGARVVLADDGRPSAADVAAGMLAPWSEAEDGEDALNAVMRRAADAWPAFAARLAEASGHPSVHVPCGTLLVCARPEDLGRVRHHGGVIARRPGAAAPAWLTGGALRDMEPGLGPDVAGGFALPGEHQADARAMLAALRAAAQARGVRLVGAAEALLRDRDGRVTGIATVGGGRIACGTVVLAAGWACSGLAPSVAVRPVKGEVLVLGP